MSSVKSTSYATFGNFFWKIFRKKQKAMLLQLNLRITFNFDYIFRLNIGSNLSKDICIVIQRIGII